jgi:hypothetical protein
MILKHQTSFNKILMKRLLVALALSLVIVSCGNKNRGELIGVKQKKWLGKNPMGWF